jgi:acyl-CoA thioester hydrolase
MAFHYYLRTRYGECDAQKVVFNARYGEYVELAVTEYFRALGYQQELASGELDYQLVKQTTEWFAPILFDDVAEVTVAMVRLGNTSFVMGCEFRVAGRPELTARSETVYVLVDAGLRKKPLPAPLRERLERGVDATTDHAGYLRRP